MRPNRKYNTIMQKFARTTTMHGFPKVIQTRSKAAKGFWLIMCAAAVSMFGMQFYQLLHKYYSYPKKVTVEIVPSAVSFPSISLCNMRNLDIMILNKLNRVFINVTNILPVHWLNVSDDPFINEYMKVVSKYFLTLQKNYDKGASKVFSAILTRTSIATNIERKLVEKAGVPFKEFIVTCRFGGIECDREKEFRQFFDHYYYNCFTYNAPLPDHPEATLAEGIENGWSTTVLTGSGMLEVNKNPRVIPGTHEWLSPMSSSEGVRIVIHRPFTQPYPHTEGFDIPPGASVSLAVKARDNLRIGPPHGNCTAEDPFDSRGAPYRLITCQKKCVQEQVVARCGCISPYLPDHEKYLNNSKMCTVDDDLPEFCRNSSSDICWNAMKSMFKRVMCARNVTAEVTRNATKMRMCGCFPPCRELTYDVTYSLAKWPATSFDGEEAYVDITEVEGYPERFKTSEDAEKNKVYSKYFGPENRFEAMKDFSRINVYIADANVVKTVEAEDYSQSQLLSDVGGQLGLWVGISVLTLAEVLELITKLCKYCYQSYGPYSQGSHFSRDPYVSETTRMNGSLKSDRTDNFNRV
ncbi:unnamed protein product [Dimorphilus gyrociliatus]|uniref:Uncharacterized protein n=1 Tax=Dimorphilus gyrociliatus TaxID=2664684 RepID=A0A7I8VXB9_9ANNE|nr:unnamed protein product [Dimorphilus gyrociliatus]